MYGKAQPMKSHDINLLLLSFTGCCIHFFLFMHLTDNSQILRTLTPLRLKEPFLDIPEYPFDLFGGSEGKGTGTFGSLAPRPPHPSPGFLEGGC